MEARHLLTDRILHALHIGNVAMAVAPVHSGGNAASSGSRSLPASARAFAAPLVRQVRAAQGQRQIVRNNGHRRGRGFGGGRPRGSSRSRARGRSRGRGGQ